MGNLRVHIDCQRFRSKPDKTIVLDVDKGLPYKDFIERAKEYEIYPFLVYKTFSASYDLEKYRAVYLCDYIIEDETAADFMNEILNRIYPEADTQC